MTVLYTAVNASSIYYSEDGINWSFSTVVGPNNETLNIQCVAYGNGVWIAGAQVNDSNEPTYLDPIILRSEDGISWTANAAPLANNGVLQNVATDANGVWILTQLFNNTMIRSLDNGLTWQTIGDNDISQNVDVLDVAYADGTWVITTGFTTVYYSTNNGTNWSVSPFNNNTPNTLVEGRTGNNIGFVFYDDDIVQTVPDITQNLKYVTTNLVYGTILRKILMTENEAILCTGQGFYVSSDGQTWTGVGNNNVHINATVANSSSGYVVSSVPNGSVLKFIITNSIINIDTEGTEYNNNTGINLEIVGAFDRTSIVEGGPVTITASREVDGNSPYALITATIPEGKAAINKIEYQFKHNLFDDFQTFLITPNQTKIRHTELQQYFRYAAMQYRAIIKYSDGTETTTNIATIGGTLVYFGYAANSQPGFKISALAYESDVNRLTVRFENPEPTQISSTTPNWFLYRVRDRATGKVIGKGFGNPGLEGLASNAQFTSGSYSAPIVSRPQQSSLFYYTTIDGILRPVFEAGSKGIIIEWGWYYGDKQPDGFVKDDNNYGAGIFFDPSFSAITTPDDPNDSTFDNPDGTATTPGTDDGTGTKVCVIGDEGPEICGPLPQEGDEEFCLENSLGEKLTCGQLPGGAGPDKPIEIRKINDIISVIYDGEVIITYEIPESEFPNLANSKGWLGFVDNNGTQVSAPTGFEMSYPLPEASAYYLQAVEIDRPLAYKRPFIYGTFNQGYTVIIHADNSITAELEPLDGDLRAAKRIFWNGTRQIIDPETAALIWNAGFNKYITIVE